VEVTTHCYDDIEVAAGKEVPAKSHRVVVNGVTYQIDLCEENEDRYLCPLTDVLAKYGQRVTQPVDDGSRRRGPVLPRDAQGRFLCPHGKCASKPGYRHQKGVFEHARVGHGEEFYRRLVDQYSTLSPEERQCGYCPKDDFFGLSGKRSHERTVHGTASD
jgi:hypothetical protein